MFCHFCVLHYFLIFNKIFSYIGNKTALWLIAKYCASSFGLLKIIYQAEYQSKPVEVCCSWGKAEVVTRCRVLYKLCLITTVGLSGILGPPMVTCTLVISKQNSCHVPYVQLPLKMIWTSQPMPNLAASYQSRLSELRLKIIMHVCSNNINFDLFFAIYTFRYVVLRSG